MTIIITIIFSPFLIAGFLFEIGKSYFVAGQRFAAFIEQ